METAYAHWRYLSLVQLEGPIVDMRDERLASGAFAKWKKKTMVNNFFSSTPSYLARLIFGRLAH